jgi:hypothetical protein
MGNVAFGDPGRATAKIPKTLAPRPAQYGYACPGLATVLSAL